VVDPVVTILADAGPTIGAGHVMRCLTLARALEIAGTPVALSTASLPSPLRRRCDRLGIRVVDRTAGLDDPDVALGLPPTTALIVRDGYCVTEAASAALEAQAPVLVVDDGREAPIGAPVAVLNQNVHATAAMYADIPPTVELMLGPRWALVRNEIVALRRRPCERIPGRVVVALGGADVLGLASTISDAAAVEGLDVVSPGGLMGSAQSGDPARFARVLASCELAIVGAGTSIWECLCLGTPTIALVTADNQEAIAQECRRRRLIDSAFDLRHGPDSESVAAAAVALHRDPARRRHLADLGRSTVDGEGAARVAKSIVSILRRT
jgi:spore coat polysaccharide biosynthesis predicted glycosyltransferase SpsG